VETDLLADLITQKRDVLVQLRDLSRRQIALVGEGEMTPLLAVLAAKQTLLEELQQLDHRLDPFREQDPEHRRWRSVEARRACQHAAQASAALLSEIMLLERHSEHDLVLRRDAAALQLAGAHTIDQARHGYARTAQTGGGQLDLTSDR
jgi:hypothetical protein